MEEAIRDYFDALERIINGKPINVSTSVTISNDAVSLEAGRSRGSIKKSRPIYGVLIKAISEAAKNQNPVGDVTEVRLKEEKLEVKRYRLLWEEALAREVSLVKQLWDERAEWAAEKSTLTGEKVSSILSSKLLRESKVKTPL